MTRGGSWGLVSEAAGEVLLERDALVDLDPEVPGPQAAGTELEDRADPLVHAQAEDLDREHVVEPVGDQAGQSVALGVDHAIGVGLLVQPERLRPQLHRPVDLVLPELRPRRLGLRVSSLRLIWERGFQSP